MCEEEAEDVCVPTLARNIQRRSTCLRPLQHRRSMIKQLLHLHRTHQPLTYKEWHIEVLL